MSSTHEWLRGCATALVTPFKAGGAVDEQRMKALVERQIAGGVKLLVPCGTTGERATMDDAEGRRVYGVAWKLAHRLPPVGRPVDLAVQLAWNFHNDRKLLQMELLDWRSSEAVPRDGTPPS